MVTDVVLDRAGGEVRVLVGCTGGARVPCPQCAAARSRFDHRSRRCGHLDTCQFRTILEVEIRRASWPEHGAHQIAAP
ncbi:MAG: transposase family protein [Planctomycetes bacterium]|nr:transposase family protein [Planctomycetota bacterium]